MEATRERTKPKRRWLRFGMRTLFAVTTVLCVFLAWIGRDLAVSYHEARIVQKTGGSARYDYEFDGVGNQKDAAPPGPAFLRYFFGDQLFARVTSLTVQKKTVDQEMIEEIATLGELKSLLFLASTIENKAMKPLPEFRKLESLGFASTPIYRTQLRQFRQCEQITSVSLLGASATDENLAELSQFSNLDNLAIWDGPATDLGLSSLASLPKLEQLYIRDVPGITAKGLPPLKNLNQLTIQCDVVSKDSLPALRQSTSLHKLTLLSPKRNSLPKPQGIARPPGWIESTLKAIRPPNPIERAALETTGQLASLRELTFDTVNILDQDLKHLSGMPNLEVLRIQSANVSREGMVHLEELPKLKELHASWRQGIKPGQVGAVKVIVDD